MTGTEKIKTKIIEDANVKALHIEEQANQEARDIMDIALRSAEQKKAELLKKADAEGAEAYRRLIAVAGLDGRKEILRAKQDMIETTFKAAMEKVSQLPDQEYQKLLEEMVISTDTKGSWEILLSEKDLHRMDSLFISNINKRLISAGIVGDLTLSKDAIQTTGGFVLRCGDVEINNTFEILFGMLRPELENDVVKILFNT